MRTFFPTSVLSVLSEVKIRIRVFGIGLLALVLDSLGFWRGPRYQLRG